MIAYHNMFTCGDKKTIIRLTIDVATTLENIRHDLDNLKKYKLGETLLNINDMYDLLRTNE